MSDRIKVAVSPFYGGEDWTDEATGIKFSKGEHGIKIYSIPADVDMKGINKAIRLNALIPVEGKFEEFNETESVKVESKDVKKKEDKKEEKKSEKKEEVKAESKEDKKEEKPKSKSASKSSSKSKTTKSKSDKK